MTSPLERLMAWLAPPVQRGPIEKTWDEVEATLGVRFGAEYRQVMDIYGSGSLGTDEFFTLSWADPRSSYFGQEASLAHDTVRGARGSPLAVYPDASSCLLWFATVLGTAIHAFVGERGLWVTDESDEWHHVEGPLPSILCDLVTGASPLIASYSPSWHCPPVFTPALPRP